MSRPAGPSRLIDGAGAGWAAARVATVAVLLAVAVIGLRARGAFSHQASSVLAGAGGTVVASVFALILLAAPPSPAWPPRSPPT